jgi:CRP/FNR family transcriptional regulator, cyclic AMP receptor protein
MSDTLRTLMDAIGNSPAYDRLPLHLSADQWERLAGYLQAQDLAAGQTLMTQGENDRSVYLLESGSLSVHFEDGKSRVRLAMVGPGSVVGERAFFSQQQRNATVQAAAPARLWLLSPMRWRQLCQNEAAMASQLSRALGQVMALRAGNAPARAATGNNA